MAPELSWQLTFTALCMIIICFLLAKRYLSYKATLVIIFVKISIPFVYFAWFFDGSWTFVDDMQYLSNGSKLIDHGWNPITILLDNNGRSLLFSLVGENNVLYNWWNLSSEYFFGKNYFSPVFMNVMLTFVSGNILYQIARLSGFNQHYAKGLLVFFLFHWDVLVWSSFTNLKDTLVMTLTLAFIFFVIKLSNRLTLSSAIGAGAVFYTFFWTRFYIPIFIILATLFWLAMYQSGRRKYILYGFAIATGIITIEILTLERIMLNYSQLDFSSISFGAVRMLLTPQPWAIEPAYSFLLLPSIIHWLLLIPAFVGGVILWRRSETAVLLLIYFLIMMLFYGSISELQGPRQRLQIAFIIAWMQFHFLWAILSYITHKSERFNIYELNYYPK